MGFATAEWVKTQFDNFSARVSAVFAKKADVYTKTETDDLFSGRAEKAKVFDTKADLEAWIAVDGNTGELKPGQNIYIKETDTPDYWWDGEQLQPLETEKVNLDGYVTSEQLSTTLDGYLSKNDAESENIDFSGYFATE